MEKTLVERAAVERQRASVRPPPLLPSPPKKTNHRKNSLNSSDSFSVDHQVVDSEAPF